MVTVYKSFNGTDEEKLVEIENIIVNWSWIDGSHHKVWVFDQIMRVLKGTDYNNWVKEYCNGDDGPFTYEWDTGVAP